MEALKKKPNNALTKKLIQKVQSEWDQAVEKKKSEFDALDQLKLDINNF